MRVKDLDGRFYNWPPTGCVPPKTDEVGKSSYHIKCRNLLQTLHPTRRIMEEVPIPGHRLFLDFYIPHRQVAIEVQGEQHFKYIPHFHGTKLGFFEAQQRDRTKAEWCILNEIDLIELRYDEDEESWLKKIV